MNIQSIKYGNEEGNMLNVTLDDGSSVFVPWPTDTYIQEHVQKWLDAGNTPEPFMDAAELEAKRVTAIKMEAGRRIIEIMPEWKQRNLLARMVELLNKETMTAEEQTEADAAQAAWDSIKAIRETSDTAETNGTALEDIVW